jgi:hypothetical protein
MCQPDDLGTTRWVASFCVVHLERLVPPKTTTSSGEIRERAFQIWIAEGQPDGREMEHWELAEFAIGQEDGLASSLVPAEAPKPEPIEALTNQGEFPTLVDQGESVAPGEIPANAGNS